MSEIVENNNYSNDQNTSNSQNTNYDGYLKMYIGPMFSGKSTALTKEYNHWTSKGYNVLGINYKLDNRYDESDSIATHDNVTIPALKVDTLEDIDVSNYDVILVDESQFFPDLSPIIEWVDSQQKYVAVSGLSGDYRRKRFGNNIDLIHHCDEVKVMKGECSIENCNKKSIFTAKTVIEEQILLNGQSKVDIGGGDKYIPLCRKCYNQNTVTIKTCFNINKN